MKLPSRAIRSLVLMALREDAAFHDLTTQALVPKPLQAKAILLAKQDLVLCGMPVASEAFRRLDPRLRLRARFSEGAFVRAGTALAVLEGSARALLSAERVALNFLQRLSGIATLTRRYVEAVRGTKAKILDTRKTTPGLRLLERYAVAVGGGTNHRFDLRAAAMAKDNHLAIAGSVSAALRGLAKLGRKVPVILEVKNAAELRAALEAGAKRILLDNMTLSQLRRAVGMTRGRAVLEASGGVNLRNVRAIAETGVDFISVGALTHSAPAVDISLEIYEVPRRHSRL
ncbi:MAG: carboxylating nicotinate-nucleotide diphosphorylase [bacterium]